MSFIVLKHNIEVAHRLSLLPGKCENIHGHSMWVELKLRGQIGAAGILQNNQHQTFEFGEVKKDFRTYLDTTYDHHLLLNENDPWAQPLYDQNTEGMRGAEGTLPGLHVTPGDPTTENLARWIARWAANRFRTEATVTVQETHVNAAEAGAVWIYSRREVENEA